MRNKINIMAFFLVLLSFLSPINGEVKIVNFGSYFAYKNEFEEELYAVNCFNYKFNQNF